jgi:hypothetical protein
MLRRSTGRVVVAGLSAAVMAVSLGTVAAYATSFTDVQANNPQVSGVNDSNTSAVFPTNKQNEPAIAVNPIDSRYLVAGSNDEQLQPPCGPGPVRGADAAASDCSFFPGVGTDGVYTSSDGGLTWTNRGLLDQLAVDPSWNPAFVSDGDPVIAWGPKPDGSGGFSYANGARVYYASLMSYAPGMSPYKGGFGGNEFQIITHSDDNGVTWSAPVVVNKSNPITFNDKNSLGVDANPASPFFGRVYVSWTAFRSAGNGNEPIMVSYSTDGGTTWSSSKQLSPAGNNGTGNGRQGSAITTTADGTVMVAFEQAFGQVVAVSRNGGVGWTRPMTIGPVTDIPDPIPGASFRTDSFASLAADPSDTSGATAYAAWVTATSTGADLVVYKTTNRGSTWTKIATPYSGSTTTGFPFFQGMGVAPNGRVDLGWQALTATDSSTFGTGNASIDSWYSDSTDGGTTWSPATKVSSQSSDPAASAQNNLALQFWGDYNTLTSANSGAWFIYTDSRNGVGCTAVDDYQHALLDGTTATKPAPPNDCNSQFGNTDVYVSVITP